MNRILIIRGGAIGDFILTLPAIKALRDAFPRARLEILGYKHIASLAEQRFYANAVQSIDYAALSGFFGPQCELNPDLRNYFGTFDLIVSYLFDPDRIFEQNVERCSAARFLVGPAKLRVGSHAARQLARPIEQLGLKIDDFRPKVFPCAEDREFAREFMAGLSQPVAALHVGSGSPKKNWPVGNWIKVGDQLWRGHWPGRKAHSLIVVSGEADQACLVTLKQHWHEERVRWASNLPLPQLGAVLSECMFLGHDSGISHLAAAAGAKCLVLFGPTDPAVWAPAGEHVQVIRAPDGDLSRLPADVVFSRLAEL